MGLLPFVKKRVKFTFKNELGAVRLRMEVDATLSLQHHLSSDISRHPVAKGESLVDNSRPNPNDLVLECFFTNVPGDIIEMGKRYATGDFNHAEKAFADIETAHLNQWTALIETRFKNYENMIIEDVGIPESVDDGASIKATIKFSEIQTASAQLVPPVQAKPTVLEKVKDKGTQTKQPPAPAQKASAAKHFLNDLGVTKAGSGVPR